MTVSQGARRGHVRWLLVTFAAVLVMSLAAPASARADSRSDEYHDLAEAYRATAAFHDVENVLAAGYLVEPTCVDYPDGYMGEGPGTMGHHFPNVSYLTDGGRLDPAEPELVLYEKRANGSWRLNAVEYVIPARDLPPTAEPPRLFGRELVFHPEIGQAGIWGLHVWLWRYNPHGRYAELNPRVSCEYAQE